MRSYGGIFLFWVPLVAQWLMMAVETPLLTAIIARMGDPVFNLAAYGVAYAFAILVESPVIMLMSASTALVEDAASYRRLRAFTGMLNAGVTAFLLLLLVPPIYSLVMVDALGLPDPVPGLVYGALWILLPWPAAIGYRRFLHGILIRAGQTRRVAYGTIARMVAMTATAFALFAWGGIHGAWVGAAALTVGVCVEAIAARFMAAGAVHELLEEERAEGSKAGSTGRSPRLSLRGFGDISRFYFPLALTSLIALMVHPMLTFFMGRAPAPVESLAVFPVVHAVGFFFRAPAFSFQETTIALVGRRYEHLGIMSRFGVIVGLGSSLALGLVAFTPLAELWFERVAGLTPELAAYAYLPLRILVPLPAVALLLAFLQALLVQGRDTKPITASSALEVVAIAAIFIIFGFLLGLTGVTAAMIAILGGRAIASAYLARHAVRRVRSENPDRP